MQATYDGGKTNMKTEYNKTTVMLYRNIKRFSQVNKHCANQQWCMKLFGNLLIGVIKVF